MAVPVLSVQPMEAKKKWNKSGVKDIKDSV